MIKTVIFISLGFAIVLGCCEGGVFSLGILPLLIFCLGLERDVLVLEIMDLPFPGANF